MHFIICALVWPWTLYVWLLCRVQIIPKRLLIELKPFSNKVLWAVRIFFGKWRIIKVVQRLYGPIQNMRSALEYCCLCTVCCRTSNTPSRLCYPRLCTVLVANALLYLNQHIDWAQREKKCSSYFPPVSCSVQFIQHIGKHRIQLHDSISVTNHSNYFARDRKKERTSAGFHWDQRNENAMTASLFDISYLQSRQFNLFCDWLGSGYF